MRGVAGPGAALTTPVDAGHVELPSRQHRCDRALLTGSCKRRLLQVADAEAREAARKAAAAGDGGRVEAVQARLQKAVCT
jgi:predicted phage gp36 major capsid-like protein